MFEIHFDAQFWNILNKKIIMEQQKLKLSSLNCINYDFKYFINTFYLYQYFMIWRNDKKNKTKFCVKIYLNFKILFDENWVYVKLDNLVHHAILSFNKRINWTNILI